MSTISLRLPESLHRQARELAEQEGISINQLIATSLAERGEARGTARATLVAAEVITALVMLPPPS